MAVPLMEDAALPLAQLRSVLAAQTARLCAFDITSGSGWDDDELRRFRVAICRIRSLMRAARPLLDEAWTDDVRLELAWLGQAAGPARDLDVLLADLRTTTAHFDAGEVFVIARPLQQLERERAGARHALVETLLSDRAARLLERLRREVPEAPAGASPSIELRELATSTFRRLRKTARSLDPNPTDEDLHDLRLDVKRSRYAAELAETEVGKPAARYILHAKELQDILGTHQDAAVAEARVRQLLGTPQSARWAVAGGRLLEAQHARREAARRAWPAVWWRLEKQGRSTWGPVRR